jgi:hypothetical protein
MKASEQAYGTAGQFFEVDGTMPDQLNCQWVVLMSVVIDALGRTFVTSFVT